VEHLLPKSWYAHWPLADGSKATEEDAQLALAANEDQLQQQSRLRDILKRERLKNTIGNLTILNSGLNEELRNSKWSVKRAAILEHTQLRMNFDLAALADWTDDEVVNRSKRIARIVVDEWPR
jgi:hypothetical protein